MATSTSPSAAVIEFLTAYHDWEVESSRIWQPFSPEDTEADEDVDALPDEEPELLEDEEMDSESGEAMEAALGQIQRSYEELLTRFVTPRVLAKQLGFAYSDPPSVDPTRVSVVDETIVGTKAIVRTHELEPDLDEQEKYEYELRLVDGMWRVDDRRTRDLDGKWIHLVF